jgi:hypothetical protein
MSETSSPPLRNLRLDRNGSNLLVMPPGAYMGPEDFVQRGFWAAVQQQIIVPARGGYRREWLGGISLGGLLSICLAAAWEHFLDSSLCGQPCDA